MKRKLFVIVVLGLLLTSMVSVAAAQEEEEDPEEVVVISGESDVWYWPYFFYPHEGPGSYGWRLLAHLGEDIHGKEIPWDDGHGVVDYVASFGVGPEIDCDADGVFDWWDQGPSGWDEWGWPCYDYLLLPENNLVFQADSVCAWVSWHSELSDEFYLIFVDDEPCSPEGFHPNGGVYATASGEMEPLFSTIEMELFVPEDFYGD